MNQISQADVGWKPAARTSISVGLTSEAKLPSASKTVTNRIAGRMNNGRDDQGPTPAQDEAIKVVRGAVRRNLLARVADFVGLGSPFSDLGRRGHPRRN